MNHRSASGIARQYLNAPRSYGLVPSRRPRRRGTIHCVSCDSYFATPWTLRRHQRTSTHTGRPADQPQFCYRSPCVSKPFSSKETLERHQLEVHEGRGRRGQNNRLEASPETSSTQDVQRDDTVRYSDGSSSSETSGLVMSNQYANNTIGQAFATTNFASPSSNQVTLYQSHQSQPNMESYELRGPNLGEMQISSFQNRLLASSYENVRFGSVAGHMDGNGPCGLDDSVIDQSRIYRGTTVSSISDFSGISMIEKTPGPLAQPYFSWPNNGAPARTYMIGAQAGAINAR